MSEIPELLEHLKRIKTENFTVIVEGINDKKALEEFNISKILTLKQALYKVVEEAVRRKKPVVILTDLDRKGKELYGKLNHKFSQFGIHIDNQFREFLFRETKLRQIEGLVNYIKRREDQ